MAPKKTVSRQVTRTAGPGPGEYTLNDATTTATTSSPSSVLTKLDTTKDIVAMMAVAITFSVIGAEIRNLDKATSPTGSGGVVGKVIADPFLVILGGTTATALLTLVALAGEPGRTLGVGLAGLTMVTALFVSGGPVWKALSNLLGAKPTTPLGATTVTTTPT